MARHKRQQTEPDEDPGLDISSLIDVCFLLLIYFLVTSTIKPRESDLSLALPSPNSAGDPPKIKPLLIHIEGGGGIYEGQNKTPLDMDGSVRELPQLTEKLQFYKEGVDATGEKPLVQIYAADDAEHQRVIDVLNALAGVKINSVTFTDLTE
ncbi:MAG: biopolymer transporter ExbD [Akkermansiaceae bacterium]|nr:biopolymer transporter ExbD [Akkermansiaceae bacterium]